jgi:hypothetical protein
MDLALDGIRVLDLSEYVSDAYCAKLPGASGAEVRQSDPGERVLVQGAYLPLSFFHRIYSVDTGLSRK